jgi:hypothetical protein
MDKTLTNQTAVQFVNEVSQQSHAMAGAVIALSAAQAAALGQACMQISQDDSDQHHQAVDKQIDRLSKNIHELLQWCDRDATAIADFVALREVGETLTGQQLLCQAPATIGQISIQIAGILQDFRPIVCDRVQDDLEMAIRLLAGSAQAAMLLLDSNLRIWPEPALLAQFEPVQEELAFDLGQLSPVERIRE